MLFQTGEQLTGFGGTFQRRQEGEEDEQTPCDSGFRRDSRRPSRSRTNFISTTVVSGRAFRLSPTFILPVCKRADGSTF